jgi:hypothetical protein
MSVLASRDIRLPPSTTQFASHSVAATAQHRLADTAGSPGLLRRGTVGLYVAEGRGKDLFEATADRGPVDIGDVQVGRQLRRRHE